ncbi:hypothetical protein NDU88_006898 [Pleurodeles waltl]|uniref:Uncharacterized protein n=1 Tax=Pleurodeles waltl TaxID=8319 RepID=A0AAV7QQ87_PLEWA|nr:hypothetical protein NDU88_006898 [Pleurodeles waltl]
MEVPRGHSSVHRRCTGRAGPEGSREYPEESAIQKVKTPISPGTGAPTGERETGEAMAEGERGDHGVIKGHGEERTKEEQDGRTEVVYREGGGRAEMGHVQGRMWPAQVRTSP